MKLLVVGSRSIKEVDLSRYIPKEATVIISGGADGVDRLAEEYADRHKISKLVLRPDYKKYGKAAPLRRNEIMVDISDLVIVVWDGKSKGTKYTADYAAKKGKDLNIITLL